MNIKKDILAVCLGAVSMGAWAQVPVKQMVTTAEIDKELANTKTIELNTKFAKLNIIQAEGSKPRIVGKLEALEPNEAYAITVNEEGETATVEIGVPTEANSAYAGELNVYVSADVTVNSHGTSGTVVLHNLKGVSLNVETAKGRVSVKDVDGNINITTKNGDVTGDSIKGKFAVYTTTGTLTFTDVEGDFRAEASEGNIQLTRASGNVTTKTVTGTQSLEDVKATFDVVTSSGVVKISKSEGVINVKSKAANVNFFKVTGEFHIETGKGQINSASSANGIKLTASSDFTTTEGKIALTLLNDVDELSFDLACESSKSGLIAKKTSKTKKLKTGKGAIVVTGRSKTGGQVYK